MSLIRACLPVAFGRPERPQQEQRKAALTCPHCGHEDPPTGDWTWSECDHGMELRCPTCDELLTVREQFERSR